MTDDGEVVNPMLIIHNYFFMYFISKKEITVQRAGIPSFGEIMKDILTNGNSFSFDSNDF